MRFDRNKRNPDQFQQLWWPDKLAVKLDSRIYNFSLFLLSFSSYPSFSVTLTLSLSLSLSLSLTHTHSFYLSLLLSLSLTHTPSLPLFLSLSHTLFFFLFLYLTVNSSLFLLGTYWILFIFRCLSPYCTDPIWKSRGKY